MIYGALFGIGKLIFKEWLPGLLYLVIAIAAGMLISWNLITRRMENSWRSTF